MNKKFLMILFVCLVSSCAFAQTKMDKFLGNLSGAVQIYERYESMYRQIKRLHPIQVTMGGTIVNKKYGRELKSLTWSTHQIEKQGAYLYVYEVNDGKFVQIGKHAMTVNQSKPYDVYILRGEYLLHHKVVIVTMDRKGYVYLKRGLQTIESYTFEIR